jgi:hypothetical protein
VVVSAEDFILSYDCNKDYILVQCVPLALAPENVGLQKEQKCNTFASHTCDEVWLCVLGIRKKEVGNTKR